ncbi:tyrosinase [Ceratobasidium sp. AG-Ba]|nr:tyrosinase [Ceratobasidium sp. AG-Ba]
MVTRNGTVEVVPASEDGSMLSDRYSETMMNNILRSGVDFENFREPFEGIPHAAIHDAIGGDMGLLVVPMNQCSSSITQMSTAGGGSGNISTAL